MASDGIPDRQAEQELQEEEEGEAPGNQVGKLELVGAVRVLPTLVDQIHLLKPGFPIQGDPDSESESALTSTQTESYTKAPTTPTAPMPPAAPISPMTPAPLEQASSKDKAIPVEFKRRGSADASVQVERKSGPELSLHIPSSEPPWIEMVEVKGGCGRDSEGQESTLPAPRLLKLFPLKLVFIGKLMGTLAMPLPLVSLTNPSIAAFHALQYCCIVLFVYDTAVCVCVLYFICGKVPANWHCLK